MAKTESSTQQLERLQLLSITETARRLGISRNGVYRLMAAKSLPWVQIGELRRVRVTDLARLIERGTADRNGGAA